MDVNYGLMVEKVHVRYLKHILNVKSGAPNCIFYGETGVKPLHVVIDTRMICCWSKLIQHVCNKSTVTVYNILIM